MVIETNRLILRPFLEGDAADVYEYLKEPAVNCFASMKLHSLDEAKAEMKKRLGETEYYFAITLKDGGKAIGEIDAYPEAGEPHAGEDAVRDTFSPCWMLNEAYQGKGYAFEAAQAFFDYLFSQKGARRIYAYTEDYTLISVLRGGTETGLDVGLIPEVHPLPEGHIGADILGLGAAHCFHQLGQLFLALVLGLGQHILRFGQTLVVIAHLRRCSSSEIVRLSSIDRRRIIMDSSTAILNSSFPMRSPSAPNRVSSAPEIASVR